MAEPVGYVAKPVTTPSTKCLYTSCVGGVYTILNTKTPTTEAVGQRLPATVTRVKQPVPDGPTTSALAGINGLVRSETHLTPVRNKEVPASPSSTTTWRMANTVLNRLLVILLSEMVVVAATLVSYIACRVRMATA